MNIIQKIKDMAGEMTTWRRHLHTQPELAFEETKTSAFLQSQLQSFGADHIEIMAKTGIVAVLHGKTNTSGKAIMLRADMDALPITEETHVPHTSTHAGVHHACGHDGHMVMLLGAAKYLAETRDFDGTVYIVFQPAEEHIGGAKEMIAEGFFQKFLCDEVYGMHNFPGLPLGMMATGKGAMLAASDEFHVTIKGKGGHSARPENTIDALSAAASAVLAIKEAAAKIIPTGDPAVLTIAAFHTDSTATNVIADEVSFNGSIRTFDPALHAQLKKSLQDITQKAAADFGASVTIEFKNGYPLLVNSDAQTDFAISVAKETVGDNAVMTQVPKTLGVEDFAEFLLQRPGNYMVIGTGVAGQVLPDIHNCKYDFNDAALPVGATYWARLVERALPVKSAPPPPKP